MLANVANFGSCNWLLSGGSRGGVGGVAPPPWAARKKKEKKKEKKRKKERKKERKKNARWRETLSSANIVKRYSTHLVT